MNEFLLEWQFPEETLVIPLRNPVESPKEMLPVSEEITDGQSGMVKINRPVTVATRSKTMSDFLSNRGTGALPPERRREIASMGGKAAHPKGCVTHFTKGSKIARAAGRKGGIIAQQRKTGHRLTREFMLAYWAKRKAKEAAEREAAEKEQKDTQEEE